MGGDLTAGPGWMAGRGRDGSEESLREGLEKEGMWWLMEKLVIYTSISFGLATFFCLFKCSSDFGCHILRSFISTRFFNGFV